MNKLAHFIVYSKAATYIAALLCIAMWVLHFVEQGGVGHSYFALLMWVLATYFSVKFGRDLSFNEARSTLPVTLFFMGCALAPQMGMGYSGVLHFLLFSTACYVLLRTYRDRSAMGSYFLAFALIGVQCLMAPPLLLTLPCVVLCGAFMESLHGRTFLASLWGLLFPYWVTCGVLFLTDRTALIVPYLGQILPVPLAMSSVLDSPQLWAQPLWVLLLVLPSSVVLLLNRTMRIQASAGYRLLMLALVVLLVTVVISPAYYAMLSPCILLHVSLIGATMFVGGENRARNIYLVILFVMWLASLGLYVWNNFLSY